MSGKRILARIAVMVAVFAFAIVVGMLTACGAAPPPAPDAPLPTCAALGCGTFALCASHDDPVCSCNGAACDTRAP